MNGQTGKPAPFTFSGLSQQARHAHNIAIITFYYKKVEISHMK